MEAELDWLIEALGVLRGDDLGNEADLRVGLSHLLVDEFLNFIVEIAPIDLNEVDILGPSGRTFVQKDPGSGELLQRFLNDRSWCSDALGFVSLSILG